ncbi:MAG: hypothetical protein ACOC7R_04075 [Planctomycetota bacterium]
MAAMILGAFGTYTLYCETGDLRCYGVIPVVLLALAASTLVTVAAFCLARHAAARVALAFALSYWAYILLIFGAALVGGDLAETLMWLPIMILFGIPFMFPLTAGVVVGVGLFVNARRREDS